MGFSVDASCRNRPRATSPMLPSGYDVARIPFHCVPVNGQLPSDAALSPVS